MTTLTPPCTTITDPPPPHDEPSQDSMTPPPISLPFRHHNPPLKAGVIDGGGEKAHIPQKRAHTPRSRGVRTYVLQRNTT